MSFRGPTIALFLLLTVFFSWSVSCTWKKHQLEKDAIAQLFSDDQTVDYDIVYDELQRKHGRGPKENPGKNPIWTLFSHKVYWEDIVNNALSKGPDILGGRSTTLQVDEQLFIEKFGRKQNANFRKNFEEAKKSYANAKMKKGFVDHFCDGVTTEGRLATYFLDSYNELKGLKNEAVRTFLHQKVTTYLTNSIKVLNSRLNVPEGTYDIPQVPKYGRLVVAANHPRKDPKLINCIAKCGKLMFYKVWTHDERTNIVNKLNKKIGKSQHSKNRPYIQNTVNYCICEVTHKSLLEEAYQNMPEASNSLLLFSNVKKNQQQSYYEIYFVKESQYKGEGFQVEEATVNKKENPEGITIKLKENSRKKFTKLTQDMQGKQLACVLDGVVLTAPGVKGEMKDASFMITGKKEDSNYWENIVSSLRSGALPCQLKIIEENSYSPSLGQEAQSQGLLAILIGLLVVVIFMMIYYAIGGLVANCSLLFNMIFIVGTLAQFGAKLSLAGIAGIALTIGMSIDSNVIIFEIIRAELRKGLPVRQAIQRGYQQAYRSIIDSNLTTLATGIILYYLGEGVIQSFATTLIIGIIASFATSVILSQLLLEVIVKLIGIERTSFSVGFSKNLFTNFSFNFLGRRKIAYLFSLCFLLGGISLSYSQGLDYGIAFTGGKSYMVRFGGQVATEDLKKNIKKVFAEECTKQQSLQEGSLQIRKLSKENAFKVVTNFAMHVGDIDVCELIKKGIEATNGYSFVAEEIGEAMSLKSNQFTIDSSAEIGATIVGETQHSAIWSVLIALLVMVIYIFLSFSNFGLAISAFLALIHDTIALFVCLAIVKYFGVIYEIDQTFLSTLLTVIGYSINDTVVIFSGIRNKLKEHHTDDIGKVANEAINTTLSRTLITSLTTFFPVCILYLIGGIALEALAFSLLCGIIWGTYSSIFIATPLAYDINRCTRAMQSKWKKKQKKSTSTPKVHPVEEQAP